VTPGSSESLPASLTLIRPAITGSPAEIPQARREIYSMIIFWSEQKISG
jgi:hypothetical protein